MNATTLRGTALAAFACVLVGGSFTANSVLGQYPYAGGQFLRYGLAFLLLVPLVARNGGAAPLKRLTARQWGRLALLAAVGMVGFNLAVLAAERTAEPAVPGVLVGCAPVIVAVLVPLLGGRRPRRAVLVGALLVAAGAFTVQGWGRTDLTGLLWSVGALAGEVGFAVLAVPVLRPLGPRLLSCVVCGVAAVESAVAGILLDGAGWLRMPDGAEAAALGWQAVIVTVVGFVCWYAGMQRIGAERATLFSGLIPVAAAATAPLVGAGSYGVAQALGSALVAAGVALGSGARVQDDARDERRVVVHRDVPAAGQPHQAGVRDDALGADTLAAQQQPVPAAPGQGHREAPYVVAEQDVAARVERLAEAGGLAQRERLGHDGLR
jgi:drug/metabolite transporter (DMT)-like permease